MTIAAQGKRLTERVMVMANCKDCLLHSMCYLTHAPSSIACCEFVDKNKYVRVVRCKDCKYFREYTKDYKSNTEKADGDCYFRVMYSIDEQFGAVQGSDFCSYGVRKDGADNDL